MTFYPSVGELVVTKTLSYMSDDKEDDVEDITDSYKYREGSINERLAVMGAVSATGGNAMNYRYLVILFEVLLYAVESQ